MSGAALVEAIDLRKLFPVSKGFFSTIFGGKELYVHAVDGISFRIDKGETLGLAGESGSGKTTTGRLVLGLIPATSGKVLIEGSDVLSLRGDDLKKMRREMQIIFQDPYESLNPGMTVFDTVAEPLIIHKITESPRDKENMVREALSLAELEPPDEFFYRYPHELSGGQRQRVCIARALALSPKFIVADEPVSSLDVSIRAQILNLLRGLQKKLGISYLYISHDLGSVRYVSQKVAVMYLGKIAEYSEASGFFDSPLHPYTKALIAAVPVPDPTTRKVRTALPGEIPSAVSPPSGCRFHPRCPMMIPICKEEDPRLIEIRKDHYVACHLVK